MSDSLLERLEEPEENALDLRDPGLYINRELSWLDFNDRVLELAEDPLVPLIERLKFLAIFTSNLDEFFMVRVANVQEKIEARIDRRGPDRLSPTRLMEEIATIVRALDHRQARQLTSVIKPALAEAGIRIVTCADSGASAETLQRYFKEHIFRC